MSNATREFDNRFKQNTISDEILPGPETKCLKCWDCGYAWMNIEGIAAWVYCKCKEGKSKQDCGNYALPRLDYEMERLFEVKKFPVKAFVPGAFEPMKAGMERKMKDFKNDLKLSEKFWKGGEV